MKNLIRSGERGLGWGFFQEFDDAVNEVFRLPVVTRPRATTRMPVMDINETEAAYLVKAELPGMRKQDLAVTINDGVLTINAEQKKEEENKNGRLIRQERCNGKFVRSLRLSTDVDEKSVMAHYQNGLLSLTLPKAKEAQPRKVEVVIS